MIRRTPTPLTARASSNSTGGSNHRCIRRGRSRERERMRRLVLDKYFRPLGACQSRRNPNYAQWRYMGCYQTSPGLAAPPSCVQPAKKAILKKCANWPPQNSSTSSDGWGGRPCTKVWLHHLWTSALSFPENHQRSSEKMKKRFHSGELPFIQRLLP